MDDLITVDASGLSCPQPVLLARQALRAHPNSAVAVLVDTATSRDNVQRLAEREGRRVAIEPRPGGGYRLLLSR